MTDEPTPTSVTVEVNDRSHTITVSADDTLAHVLRTRLDLMSCRETCGMGLCGSCTVIVDDRAVNACLMPAFQLDGAKVRTAEGLEAGATLSPLQASFIAHQAFQCSFCTPGFLMSSTAMLDEEPSDNIERVLAGHICRCGSYEQILDAVHEVAETRQVGQAADQTARGGGSDCRDI